MNIIVTGSRSFTDATLFARKMDKLLSKLKQKPKIIVGDAKNGADRFAKTYCFLKGLSYDIYHADWNKHGKAAGPIRNKQMVKESGAKVCIAFWDGKSPGTKDCIEQARKAGMKVRIIKV